VRLGSQWRIKYLGVVAQCCFDVDLAGGYTCYYLVHAHGYLHRVGVLALIWVAIFSVLGSF
jgi:hypothetical protein